MPSCSPRLSPPLSPILTPLALAAALFAGSAGAQTAQRLEAVTVTGQAAQLRKALSLQREALTVLSAVSADDIGALPDKNAAEALARLPGVALQRDQGEGRYVVVRGLAADYNAVSVNGSLLPSPEAGRRGVALDTLPAGMVRTLALRKSLTPEQDAGSLGGTTEVTTLTAFDLPTSLLSGGISLSHDSLLGKTGKPGAQLLWARRGEGLGLAIGASSERREFASDNIETGGAWSGERLSGFELRDYLPVRERHALAFSLDARGDAGSAWLRGMASRFSDNEIRDRLTISNVANSAATPGGYFAEGQSVTARAERRLRQRKYTQQMTALQLGGERRWADWTLRAELAASGASEDTPESINDARFRQNNVAGLSFSDSRKPLLAGPAALWDASRYALNGFTLQARDSQDKARQASFDVERRLPLLSDDDSLKFGLKATRRDKRNDTEQWGYTSSNASSGNYWGTGSTTLADFVGGERDYQLGRIGAGIEPGKVRERLAALPRAGARLVRESAINDYRIDEDVDAAYAQLALEPVEGLDLLAGVRVERTERLARGNEVTPAAAVRERLVQSRQRHWLPGLHLRWALDAQTQLRAAVWSGLVRPNFNQLAPGVNLSSATEASVGNPELKPLRARNLDLGIERQLGRDGAVSIYGFDKRIRDFVVASNIAGSGPWVGFTSVSSFSNGDAARVRGVELSWQQSLRELGLDGWLLGANASLSSGHGQISAGGQTRRIRLPGQAERVANLMLGYEQGALSARLALNHKSDYLLELGGNGLDAANDRIVDAQRQLDLSLAWRIDRQWQLQLGVENLGKEVYYVYQGSKAFNAQHEQYGRTVKLTLKAALF